MIVVYKYAIGSDDDVSDITPNMELIGTFGNINDILLLMGDAKLDYDNDDLEELNRDYFGGAATFYVNSDEILFIVVGEKP